MIIIQGMNDYLPRCLEMLVRKALSAFPVVVLTGARQTGKSTLVRHLGRGTGRRYLTLDDIEVLDRSQREPDALPGSIGRPPPATEPRSPTRACHLRVYVFASVLGTTARPSCQCGRWIAKPDRTHFATRDGNCRRWKRRSGRTT